MSKIRILSDHVANQIAAGEVVERPASVVKELVENSLDAGAKRISIDIEGGGVRLIRISDNGSGMDEDDVLLSIERHATSKLREEKDLSAIATLGFRGEALPSIGSVAKMTILSRPENADVGTRAEMTYGRLTKIHQDGCARGTLIEIRSLFGNVPARKKFLKTRRTELFHIEEAVRNQALAHPQVEFFLHTDGRQTLHFPKARDLEERFRQVYHYQDMLLTVRSQDTPESTKLVQGFLLPPESPEARTARLRLLVNNRSVRDRMIAHAVREGLHGFLMKGRQPAGVLLLKLPRDQVDINVHPAKQEIKFRAPQEIHQAVSEAVQLAIADYQHQLKSDLFVVPNQSQPQKTQVESFSRPGDGYQQNVSVDSEPVRYSPKNFPPVAAEKNPHVYQRELHIGEAPVNEDKPSFTGLTLIGQCFDLYLFFEKNDELVVIDQHAAHERIIYEQLRRAYFKDKITSQILLFPKTIELSREEGEIFAQYQETIATMGFGVEHFGDDTYVIKAVPALLGHVQADKLLNDILEGFKTGKKRTGKDALAALLDDQLASMACKAAVKSGNRLAPQEMIGLLEQMRESSSFSHCPHGRPVMKTFTRDELKKWFYRT